MSARAIRRVVELAIRDLSPAQARCAILHCVEGWTEEKIGDAYGCSQSGVHQVLWGQGASKARGSRTSSRLEMVFRDEQGTSGAVSRLSKAIKDDPVMQQIVIDRAKPEVSGPVARDLNGWFDACRHRPEFFAAYSTMILLDNIADASGRISISELSRQMPPAIVHAVLPQLRAFGMIDNNVEPGVVRILKLPGAHPTRASMLATSSPSATRVAGDDIRSPEDSIIERLDAEAEGQA